MSCSLSRCLRVLMIAFALSIGGVCAGGVALADDEFSSARHYPGLMTKWREIQSRMSEDAQHLAACRADPQVCHDEERHLAVILDSARDRQGRARVGHINRAVNLSIRPISDLARFGIADRWASPSETLQAGGGDCEDYAILKFLILREAGFADSELKLLIVRQPGSRTDHAVLAAKIEGEWLLLDNRRFSLVRLVDSSYRVLAQLQADPIAETAGVEMASAAASDLPPLL